VPQLALARRTDRESAEPKFCAVSHKNTARRELRKTTLRMAVVAPMPKASDNSDTSVDPALFRSVRAAHRTS
jgi:hypothetical protein